MKSIARFFAVMMFMAPVAVWADAPLTGTAGSNLTAFTGTTANFNNNSWNQMTNQRTAVADFGNCNALVLRCAQPKCATGGCISMEIAYPIVAGCVLSNDTCKAHGDALIQTIAAQLVANSTARANAAANEAAANAAASSSAQSEQQMMQMQSQMQELQSQIAQQNAASQAAIESALAEQRAIAEQQAAESAKQAEAARAAVEAAAPADAIANAASMGVSADILAREQASGQILSQLENAMVAMKNLKVVMQETFDYAGCDPNGNTCTGPKRVRVFKQRAEKFFDPYEAVLDEVYDALIMAQSLGVDITDIYMMLNGTCNVWGKYLCSTDQTMHYTADTCKDGMSKPFTGTGVRGNTRCTIGQVIPMSDGGCQLIQMLNSQAEIEQNWLYPEQNIAPDGKTIMSEVRVGCASEALENSALFRNRKKQATIDIETLKRIIGQDAPNVIRSGKPNPDAIKFCAVSDTYELEKAVSLKKLPDSVCISEAKLNSLANDFVAPAASAGSDAEYNSYGYINQAQCNIDATHDKAGATCRQLSDGKWYVFGGESSNAWTTLANCQGATAGNYECYASGPGFMRRFKSGLLIDCSNSMWAYTDQCKCGSSGGTWNALSNLCECGLVKTRNPISGYCELLTAANASQNSPLYSALSSSIGINGNALGGGSTRSDAERRSNCNLYKGFWNLTSCDCTSAPDGAACMRATSSSIM